MPLVWLVGAMMLLWLALSCLVIVLCVSVQKTDESLAEHLETEIAAPELDDAAPALGGIRREQ